MRLLAACLAAACGAAVTAAPVPKDKQKTTTEKLVGTWELVKNSKGNVEGVTVSVEFTKDGKMAVKYVPKEKDAAATTLNGKFKAEGEKIDYTIDDGMGGTRGEILTIKKLTEDELITVDPDNIQEDFKRVKEKKDEKKEEKKPVKD
jgi:uncharacterized protein (TIGR03066 family)